MESPSEHYGVANLDTGAVITASGTVMVADGGGWKYDIADSVDDQQYRYYIKAVVNSVNFYLPRTTQYITSACLVIGRYTNSHQIENQFGVENVHKWLAIDERDEAIDYAMRYAQFINDAEDEIDDILRESGQESIPLGAEVPSLIKRVACALAGVRAYESRGIQDVDNDRMPVNRVSFQQKWALKKLDEIRGGCLRLTTDEATRFPEVVTDCLRPRTSQDRTFE
jgi:hypothetical protein